MSNPFDVQVTSVLFFRLPRARLDGEGWQETVAALHEDLVLQAGRVGLGPHRPGLFEAGCKLPRTEVQPPTEVDPAL